ncbi:protein IMPACT-like [Ruditapes philippinarum]|uniref:protein IMPACT-like n=1 Tax=Ruditapes philippinarum TaxID=129788 RepID=UPI00295AEB8E|nr:protein IMPACT-like [Ruditapes philippinarum]
MSNEDNATLQRDEIEALSAIYGDEWCIVDEEHKIYCIEVTDGQTKPVWKICIQVHLPEDYPSESPPEYQINAPWLRGDEKRNLEAALADIYCENLGESIVYLWTEKIREFLQAKITSPVSDGGEQLSGERQINLTTEVDHGDDFDLSLIETLSNHSDHSIETSDDLECPVITHGACVTDRRSTFQPHLAPVSHKCQIKMVLDKLYENKKIANATHNIYAYRITTSKGSNNVMLQGCEDDGETHAGGRMLHLLQILNAENVIVIVSRWYGGILLGPDRFKHINNCTRTILQECDYIKEKGDKKGPKSSGEKKKR